MRNIELTITFSDDSGPIRQERRSVDTQNAPDRAGEHRVAHLLFAELRVTVANQPEPKHNAVAQKWLDFPGQPSGIEHYFDIQNSQAMWFELTNLVMGAEDDLMLAQAFKALEPSQEPSFDDDEALNDLYYIHGRKMTLLNQSVQDLVKVQDLVNRLLHESLGGYLVNTSKPDWEKVQLTRENVEKGLESKRATGFLSQSGFDAIVHALAMPKHTPRVNLAQAYRNRLAHHVRPSVDYAIFYSYVESRAGEEIVDQRGTVIGRRHFLRSRPPLQYRFEDLLAAYSEYLDALVKMLQELSQIEMLRR